MPRLLRRKSRPLRHRTELSRSSLFFAALCSLVSLEGVATAAEEPLKSSAPGSASEPRRGLKEFQELAEKQGGELLEQQAKVEFAKARQDFASSKGLPSGNLDAVSGVIPDAVGNAVTGATNWDSWG